jgi:hypothetical protein
VQEEPATEGRQDQSGRRASQVDLLIKIGEEVELFHSPDGTGYADVTINDHRETWPIRRPGFRRWLCRRFYDQAKGAPNSNAIQSALNVLEAHAQFDSPQRQTFIRVADCGEKLYLDLADLAWRAIEIDREGWRIVEEPPVRFLRPAGMQPLPAPAAEGSVESLQSYLNISKENDFILVQIGSSSCVFLGSDK